MKLMYSIRKKLVFSILIVFLTQVVVGQDYVISTLGNSITQGHMAEGLTDDTTLSYRYRLWRKFVDEDITVDFVGTLQDVSGGPNPDWPIYHGQQFDQDHEGHAAFLATDLNDSIVYWMQDYAVPDIALIHAGTNDMFYVTDISDVEKTIAEIEGIIHQYRQANPDISIFLAKIIPTASPLNSWIIELNNRIPNIATDLLDDRSPIHIVDCYTPIDPIDDLINDLVHPNGFGEEKIAAAFMTEILNNLPEKRIRWNGSISSDWNLAGNWYGGVAPDNTSNVVIPEGCVNWPVFSGNFFVGSTVKTLTIDGAAQFTVNGNLGLESEEYFIIRGEPIINVTGDWINDGTSSGGGKIEPSTTGQYVKNGSYNRFNCSETFILNTATIYGLVGQGEPSYRTFYWADNTGAEQESATVWIEEGINVVDLNFTITPGTNLRLGVYAGLSNDLEIFRDKEPSGGDLGFPFHIGGVASITTTNLGTDYYMWFYNITYTVLSNTNKSIFGAGKSEFNFTGSSASELGANPIFTGGGKIDKGDDGTYVTYRGYNIFHCYTPFTLHSAKVYCSVAGTKKFFWATSDDVVQDSIVVDVPVGEVYVDLNFQITPGNNHRIGVLETGGARLWRDNLSPTEYLDFPYPIGNVGLIVHGTFGFGGTGDLWWRYLYLYDFKISSSFSNVNISKAESSVTTSGYHGIAENLTVEPDAWLSSLAGDSLTIGKNLLLKADATGMASFIDKGTLITGATNAEQYVTSDQWHYVSSPINNGLSGVYTGAYLKYFTESTYDWNYITAIDDPLGVMTGYSVWNYTDPYTANFSGTLNSGNQSIVVTSTANGQEYEGYNLVGNPYPSALDWDADPGWTKTNVDNTIYFYEGDGDGGLGNYRYYVGTGGSAPGVGIGGDQEILSGIIPSMQGFFVRASADGLLSVTPDAQVHSSQDFYKQGKSVTTNLPQVRLVAKDSQNAEDETVIRFYEESTENHDGMYDAFKLFGYLVPGLYSTTTANEQLAINTLPEYDEETVVPIGFSSSESGTYTISLKEFVNFDDGISPILEDNLTGEIQVLSENPNYTFVSSLEDDPDRFMLRFGFATEIDLNKESKVHVYSFENKVVVKIPENSESALIRIYDLLGKELYSEDISGMQQVIIPVNSETGHYIVKVQTNNSLHTEKVFIN